MFARHEPVVHFEVQVSITFERPVTEMNKLELLEAARELRVLRYTRSRNVQSPVYRHIVALEEQIAWRYAGVAGRPDGWQSGQPLPTDLLFASHDDFLGLYERTQGRVDAAEEQVAA